MRNNMYDVHGSDNLKYILGRRLQLIRPAPRCQCTGPGTGCTSSCSTSHHSHQPLSPLPFPLPPSSKLGHFRVLGPTLAAIEDATGSGATGLAVFGVPTMSRMLIGLDGMLPCLIRIAQLGRLTRCGRQKMHDNLGNLLEALLTWGARSVK